MAYRDPREANARLDALIRRDGFASGARRIESDPAQLGAYAGKTGLFAGAAAREARAIAERVVESIGSGLARLGEAEGQAHAITAPTSSGSCRRMRPGFRNYPSARR
jgi:hypothetical protein